MNTLKSVSINVSNDNNLMHIFYTPTTAFSVDTTHIDILKLCLRKTFTKSYYHAQEITKLDEHPERKLLFTLTTHHHFDHSCGDYKIQEVFTGIQQFKFCDVKCVNGRRSIDGRKVDLISNVDGGQVYIKKNNYDINNRSAPVYHIDGANLNEDNLTVNNDKLNGANININEDNIDNTNINEDNIDGANINVNEDNIDNTNKTNINNKIKYTNLKYLPEYIKVLHTPCHTTDSVCYIINNKWLITGDTIFFLGCGKFFEGTAEDMFNNIYKIKQLDDNLILLYGHDYSYTNILFTESCEDEMSRESFEDIDFCEDEMYKESFKDIDFCEDSMSTRLGLSTESKLSDNSKLSTNSTLSDNTKMSHTDSTISSKMSTNSTISSKMSTESTISSKMSTESTKSSKMSTESTISSKISNNITTSNTKSMLKERTFLTLGEEKQFNMFFKAKNVEELRKLRQLKDRFSVYSTCKK